MEYELEVFEVYNDFEQSTSKIKRHKKRTRKKRKPKRGMVSAQDETEDSDEIYGTRNSGETEQRRRAGLWPALGGLLGKVFSWRTSRRYRASSAVPERIDVLRSSKGCCRDYVQCGECITNLEDPN